MFSFVLLIALANASIVTLNQQNFDSIVDGSHHVFVKCYAPWCGHCKALAPTYIQLEKDLSSRQDLIIAELDCDNKDNSEVCGRLGIQGFPTLKFYPKGSTTPVDYNGGRKLEELKAFIDEQSKPKIPTRVVSLTDDTFEKIVNDPTKNVFVKFFAPWCGHCKALAPKYTELSRMYAGEEDFIMAEVDCTVNTKTCGKFEVHGYPTLKSFPKDNKAGVAYEGSREIKDFVTYFNTNYGYDRDETGKVGKMAGRIAELDEIAAKFVAAENKEALIKKAEAIANNQYYVKVMKKISEKGADYVETEKARIQKMLAGGSFTPKKIDDFGKKLNILTAFAEN